MVLENLTFFPIFGIPAIAYGGIVTLICLLVTLYTGIAHKSVKLHSTLAIITVILGAIHGLLAILAYV